MMVRDEVCHGGMARLGRMLRHGEALRCMLRRS
jgi:hypothetical protein